MKIRLAGIKKFSVADGPGIRTVIFMQGCKIKCKGCHNKSTWDLKGGYEQEIESLTNYIDIICSNKKITISGGEPLLQLKELEYLLQILHEKKYDVCLYTGYNIEDIPKSIFKYLNYIKIGKYYEEFKDLSLKYVGSSNQKFYKVEFRGENLWLKEI